MQCNEEAPDAKRAYTTMDLLGTTMLLMMQERKSADEVAAIVAKHIPKKK